MLPRPFTLIAYYECPISADEPRRIPPHRLLIEPLVLAAQEIRVFQSPKYTIEVPMPPNTMLKKGQWQLDQTKELVRGFETFWNAGAWRRGAINLRVNRDAVQWVEILHWTEYGGVPSSRFQIKKSTPLSAVNYCDVNAVDSTVVFSFSASNGIQWVDVWADNSYIVQLNDLAQSTCRKFVRACEIGKYPSEIVYNEDDYRQRI